ncbi:CapA family protein [Flavobacterium paronense]|uniref:CapA family protein n=1 Tax=Flavobacterium paronense TaxID=1392775 RepID=A0ABV5GAM0_9FLAO|nr:CapA family protein [Flavobacterium paronense]MDN3676677.1 CapA family protein [Flavobacterium paronense]
MIKIGFTGDFCPWRRVEKEFQTDNWQPLFEETKPFFESNDLNVIDLECPLTTSSNAISKTGPHIKSHPQTASILNYLNCKLVATANNHFKDYGWEGMQETYEALNKHHISWLGSGANFEEASKTFYWKKEDVTIAFINAAENEWTTTFGAEPGCHPIDLANVFNQIQEAKKTADFVVIVAHGGHEHYELPSPRIKKWYRFFVDAGANAVIAHHTHIISGYEVYKEAPIFYSLGNFCFDWEGLQNLPWNKGMLVRLGFEKNKPITFETEFVYQNSEQVGLSLLNETDKKVLQEHLQKLNTIIADDTLLESEFNKYVATWKALMNTWIQPYKGKIMAGLYKRGFLPSIITKRKKLLYTNLIRCEAHRDILLQSINPTK